MGMPVKTKHRLGEEKLNNQGIKMKIIDYKNCDHIQVLLYDKNNTVVNATYNNFKKGTIKSKYAPTIFWVGYTGEKYPISYRDVNRNKSYSTIEYDTWYQMLRRCYEEKTKNKCPTYKECLASENFHNFEFFYEWITSQENYEKWEEAIKSGNKEKWSLDKDILYRGNKIYSEKTCCLVPQRINVLVINQAGKPSSYNSSGFTGVSIESAENKCYRAECMCDGKSVFLGRYNTLEEAVAVYKNHKKKVITSIAKEEFDKGNITEKCYNSLLNWEV